MAGELYSVEQVAELLGLHVRTVRGYIRAGQLPATRIGKQYRIRRTDLAAFTGQALTATEPPRRAPRPDVSSIVRLDEVGRAAADRIGTVLQAAANTNRDPAQALHIQITHDEDNARLTVVIIGGPAPTADLLHLLESILGSENGLLGHG